MSQTPLWRWRLSAMSGERDVEASASPDALAAHGGPKRDALHRRPGPRGPRRGRCVDVTDQPDPSLPAQPSGASRSPGAHYLPGGFPPRRRQGVELGCGILVVVLADAEFAERDEHGFEIGDRTEVVELARAEDGQQDGEILAVVAGSDEEGALSALGHGSQGLFADDE